MAAPETDDTNIQETESEVVIPLDKIPSFKTKARAQPSIESFEVSKYQRTPKLSAGLPKRLAEANTALKGYATLDPSMMGSIKDLKNRIRDYCSDSRQERPFNVLMVAPSGGGKTYFVRCLGDALKKETVTANLSTSNVNDVISYAVNEARNKKAKDKIPLIFFDEADSHNERPASLLPLLWDGQFTTTGQVLEVGTCVIICAISSDNLLKFVRKRGAGKPPAFDKIVDFLSRFNGGMFRIPKLSEKSRKSDRLILATKFIHERIPRVDAVSIGLLQFLATVPILHEARSIEFLVNLIPVKAPRNWGQNNTEVLIPSRDNILYPYFKNVLSGNYPGNAVQFHIPPGSTQKASDLWEECSRNFDPISIKGAH